MADHATEKRYKIGEVCRIADLQPYVLRYWETEFPPLAPNKTGGGQRLYTQRDLDIILRIKQLLYSEGFTIAGAKKKLEAELSDETSPAPVEATPAHRVSAAARGTSAHPDVIASMREELAEILAILKRR